MKNKKEILKGKMNNLKNKIKDLNIKLAFLTIMICDRICLYIKLIIFVPYVKLLKRLEK